MAQYLILWNKFSTCDTDFHQTANCFLFMVIKRKLEESSTPYEVWDETLRLHNADWTTSSQQQQQQHNKTHSEDIDTHRRGPLAPHLPAQVILEKGNTGHRRNTAC